VFFSETDLDDQPRRIRDGHVGSPTPNRASGTAFSRWRKSNQGSGLLVLTRISGGEGGLGKWRAHLTRVRRPLMFAAGVADELSSCTE